MEKAGEDRGDRADQQTTGQAKWTFLVYMAGDNNLDGAALRDIAEMAKAGSTKDVHILVQLDRIEDQKTRRFRITQGGGFKKDCIETFGDTNTGDPQVLYSFCQWAIANYPADRYALILWNHGSGWWEEAKSRAAGPVGRRLHRQLFRHTFPQAHRSICYDDTSGGDALDNRELRVVLAGICTLLGRKIDLLGMDACLMNMVEVAYQLRDSVQVIVGSEIEEPFDGWPYAEILSRLASRPRQDPATFARWIVKSYLASYQGKGEIVTQSALDTVLINNVVAKIDALSKALVAALETDAKLIAAARKKSPCFYDDNYIDLLCFAKHLRHATTPDLRATAEALLTALKPGKGRLILSQGKIGLAVRGTGGLSIYFPGDRINPAYRDLDFCDDCRWPKFLERYLQ
ncbi:MAG: clostripain-related cysteine peptidase [Deltaproteobacteria bacterium]|nr:clostripain-related cysteine peptidase [Deltaproteobacteria bacterium]